MENWRDAIREEVGGDVQFIWHDVMDECVFVAKTVKIGSPERFIAGTSKLKDGLYISDIMLDIPVEELLSPKDNTVSLGM